MRKLIYQYWDGTLTPGNEAGSKMMKQYADRIGADYKFELNPKWRTDLGAYTAYYGAFKPIFDSEMSQYDYVLFVDTDVIPVDSLTEDIFDQFIGTDVEIGICEEWNQPAQRAKNVGHINNKYDNIWINTLKSKYPDINFPLTPEGWPKVYNSGVVVYSKKGMDKFRENYVNFKTYITWMNAAGLTKFYECDQPYLHAMLEVCKFNWITMDYKWNSAVHYTPGTSGSKRPVIDLRNNRANFVHIQLRFGDCYDYDTTWRVANLPVDLWNQHVY